MLKVLIITYYWPPAGGPGVQRWLKFVKYLKDYGIEPVVYIPENPTYPIIDDSLVSDIPEGTTILKHRIFEPYRFAQFFSKKETKTISKGIIAGEAKQSWIQKLMLYIRGNFFIPDARKFWVKPSIGFLERYIKEHNISTIITTGPPHSVHLIGKRLKELLPVNWLADFRDPWTTIGYHDKLKLTKKSQQKHILLEKQVLNTADHIVVTSFATKKEFIQLTNKPVTVITNGYDREEVGFVELDTLFTISHIGSLLSGRNPKNLWKALYDLTIENKVFAEKFRLQLVGAVGEDVLSSIKKAGLSPFLELKGYVSHREAVQLQRSSQVLLLVEIDSEETKSIIPGKLFEYMVSKRPILALGPKAADISKLIKETKSGMFLEYDQYTLIKDTLLAYFEKFQKGKLISEVSQIDQYSRKELTNRLADILKHLSQ